MRTWSCPDTPCSSSLSLQRETRVRKRIATVQEAQGENSELKALQLRASHALQKPSFVSSQAVQIRKDGWLQQFLWRTAALQSKGWPGGPHQLRSTLTRSRSQYLPEFVMRGDKETTTEAKQSAVQGSSHVRGGRDMSLGTAFHF